MFIFAFQFILCANHVCMTTIERFCWVLQMANNQKVNVI